LAWLELILSQPSWMAAIPGALAPPERLADLFELDWRGILW
jgi:hypothetical protein